MASVFPAREYMRAESGFLGKEAITVPSLLKVFGNGELIQLKNVLDVGCGNGGSEQQRNSVCSLSFTRSDLKFFSSSGRFSTMFLEWGAETVTGIDPNEDMIRSCLDTFAGKRLFRIRATGDVRLSFYCTPVQDLKEREHFGLAVGIHVLQFLENVDELKKVRSAAVSDGDMSQACRAVCTSLEENAVFVGLVPNGVPDFNPKPEEGHKLGGSSSAGISSWSRIPGAAFETPTEPLRDGLKMTVRFYGPKKGCNTLLFHFLRGGRLVDGTVLLAGDVREGALRGGLPVRAVAGPHRGPVGPGQARHRLFPLLSHPAQGHFLRREEIPEIKPIVREETGERRQDFRLFVWTGDQTSLVTMRERGMHITARGNGVSNECTENFG